MGSGLLSTLAGRADRAAQWSAVALGFSIPLFTALDSVLLLFIVGGWLASGAWGAKWEAVRGNHVVLAALALFGLLAIGTLYGGHSPRDAAAGLLKYQDLLWIPVLVWVLRDAATRRRAIYALAASLALVLAISFLTAAGMPVSRPFLGSQQNPIVFKQYLTHGVLMAFGAFLFAELALAETSRWRRALWSGAALAASVNVFLVKGRTGYLVLAVLALYLVWCRLRWRGRALALAAMIAAGAALVTMPGPFAERLGLATGDRASSPISRFAHIGIDQRFAWYDISADIIREHPLLGIGTGGFPAAYAQRAPDSPAGPTRHPHNEYLNITVQIGLPGLLALLCLFWAHWRAAPRLGSAFEQHLARGLLLMMAVGCLFNSWLLDHTEGLLYAWLTALLFAGPSPPRAGGQRTVYGDRARTPPRSVLVVVTRRIGDVLLATPVMRSVKRAWPHAAVDALVIKGTEGVIAANPDLRRVLAVPQRPGVRAHLRFIWDILRRYDMALSILPSDRSTIYAFLGGRWRAGLHAPTRKEAWKRLLLHQWTPFDNVNTHTVTMDLALADKVGVPRSGEVVVSWSAEDEQRAAQVLGGDADRPLAVLHPCPKFNYKMWRPEGWIEVARWLAARGFRLALTGSGDADEMAYVEGIARGCPPGTINAAGRLALGGSACLVSRARIYIGPDTAMTHIAAALGVPTVAIYGPTNPVKWGPWPRGHAPDANPWRRCGSQRVGNVFLLQGTGACVPCHLEGCERNIHSMSDCLHELPAARVLAAAEQLLAERA